MGYDRVWGWSSTDWSQEESRRPNAAQKSSRLLALATELCFSSTLCHHLPYASIVLADGGAIGIRERGRQEGQEQ